MIIGRFDEMYLREGTPLIRVLQEVLSGTLQVAVPADLRVTRPGHPLRSGRRPRLNHLPYAASLNAESA
jgi:hypothetical protein